MDTTSLYFHIPFCKQRCGYCDFNTFAGLSHLIPQYVEALCQEQEQVSKTSNQLVSIGTIFFGGGTPSLLSVAELGKILDTARSWFELAADAEISLEANPGTVSEAYLHGIREIGINRVSFGMQSAHPDDLRLLNRFHCHEDVINAVKWSKRVGFERINLDLIFGIPNQTLSQWESSLTLALAENVDHFSLYSLSVEEGTPLQSWIKKGLVPAPDDDLAADMYELAIDKLAKSGYYQYEISNWAMVSEKDYRCQHNLQYWRFLPYLGFGAGAHGFKDGVRTENVSGVEEYIKRFQSQTERREFPASPACTERQVLSLFDQMQEYMMVGLRMIEEGVSARDFLFHFGHPMNRIFSKQINRLKEQKLIEQHPQCEQRLRLTSKGCFFGNQVFSEFVGNRLPDELSVENYQ